MEISDPIVTLLQDYSELNPTHVQILTEPPSALEFMRYVSLNRPFVIRAGAANWEATRSWNISTLKRILKGQYVKVAITPHGNADSPIRNENDGELLFVKPWEERQEFEEFVDFIVQQEKHGSSYRGEEEKGVEGEVRYAQSQNDNLRNEYISLLPCIEKDIPWARIALEKDPDAINLWLGNSRSVTALHRDNYENIYVQIIGKKHFHLLPPVAYACVGEQMLTPASYVKKADGKWEVQKEENDQKVPFPTWDINRGSGQLPQTKYSSMMMPMNVTLEEGDILYLPTLWSVNRLFS